MCAHAHTLYDAVILLHLNHREYRDVPYVVCVCACVRKRQVPCSHVITYSPHHSSASYAPYARVKALERPRTSPKRWRRRVLSVLV